MLIRSISRVAELSSGFSSPLCEIRSEKRVDSVDLDFERRAKQGKGSTGVHLLAESSRQRVPCAFFS
jgi:hypothetical protein